MVAKGTIWECVTAAKPDLSEPRASEITVPTPQHTPCTQVGKGVTLAEYLSMYSAFLTQLPEWEGF